MSERAWGVTSVVQRSQISHQQPSRTSNPEHGPPLRLAGGGGGGDDRISSICVHGVETVGGEIFRVMRVADEGGGNGVERQQRDGDSGHGTTGFDERGNPNTNCREGAR